MIYSYYKQCYFLYSFIWLSNLWTLSVPDENCSRDASCALNWIYIRLYQERTVVIPLTGSNRHICMPVPSQDLYFHVFSEIIKEVIVYFVDICEIDYHKLSVHNNTSTYRPSATICVHVTVDINDI